MNFKLKLSLAAMALCAMAGQVRAQGCGGAGVPFGNFAIGTFGNLVGTAGTDYNVRSWVLSQSAAKNNGTCPQANQIGDFGGGNFYIYIDWSATCNVGCSAIGGPANTAVINYRVNEGAAGHGGQYALVTAAWNAGDGGWNVERITNGNGGTAGCPGGIACQVRPLALPLVTMSTDPGAGSTYNHTTGTGLVRFTFTQPALLRGFFDVNPGIDIITGYEVRQINVPDTACNVTPGPAPTTSTAASWTLVGTLANTDCAAGSCTKLLTATVPACNRAYFASALSFEGGFTTTSFVSANSTSTIAGPTATQGYPSRVEVFNTTTGGRLPGVQVRWTTTNESNIAGFNILASKTQGGVYKTINSAQIPSVGNPNTYLQTVSNRSFIAALGPASTVYLKLVTVLRDGTTREVGPVSFALTGLDRELPTGKGAGARQR